MAELEWRFMVGGVYCKTEFYFTLRRRQELSSNESLSFTKLGELWYYVYFVDHH